MATDGGSSANGTDGGTPTDNTTSTYVVPSGLAAAVFAFCIFFSVAALLTVSLRIWVRARAKMLGLDDWCMMAGLVLFLVDAGLAAYATFLGLGTSKELVAINTQKIGLKVSHNKNLQEFVAVYLKSTST